MLTHYQPSHRLSDRSECALAQMAYRDTERFHKLVIFPALLIGGLFAVYFAFTFNLR